MKKRKLGDRERLWLWLALAFVLIILTALLAVSVSRQNDISGEVPSVKVRRSRLAAGAVEETGWYTDRTGQIKREDSLISGLRYFYEQTGVQPYLYLTESDVLPTEEALKAEAALLCETLFTDEGHLVLLVRDSSRETGTYLAACAAGKAALSVVDEEAQDILLQYLAAAREHPDRYPAERAEQLYSDVFRSTARNIMGLGETRGWVVLLVLLTVVMLGIALRDFRKAWRAAREAEREEKKPSASPQRTNA